MISRNILVILVGLVIFVTLLDGSTTPLWLINECPQETSLPCMLGYPEIQEVCVGQSASANITLRLPQVIMNDLTLTHVKVLVRDEEFSRGSLVAGQSHDGDERVERWKIKIIFDSDTMIYEVKNAEIQYRDEFVCHLELDIGGQKFLSDPFQWFVVDDCIPPTKPPATDKDTSLLDLAVTSEIMGSIKRAVNCSDQLSEMHEALENVKTKLDTQNNRLDKSNKMDIAQIVVLVLVLMISFFIVCNNLSSSTTADHSTVHFQSSSSLASRNQDESSLNEGAKQLLQGDTESTLDLNPSEHSTVRFQSSSSLASRNQDEPSPNEEAKQLLQEDTDTFLNLNPSDEHPKIPDAIQKYTNGRPSADDEQHCHIEMTNIE